MRKSTRTAAVALSATALASFTMAAAGAASTGSSGLLVCVKNSHGASTHVSIDRRGAGGFREGFADNCKGFGNLRSGTYDIDIDPPSGFRTSDDDRVVHVSAGETKTVLFYLTRVTPPPPPPPPPPSRPTCSDSSSGPTSTTPACEYVPAGIPGPGSNYEFCADGYRFVTVPSTATKTPYPGGAAPQTGWTVTGGTGKCVWTGPHPVGTRGHS